MARKSFTAVMAEQLVELEGEIERTKARLAAMEQRAQFFRDHLMGRASNAKFDPGLDDVPAKLADMIEVILSGSEGGLKVADIAQSIRRRYRSVSDPVVSSTLHRMKKGQKVHQKGGLWIGHQQAIHMRPVRVTR